MLMDRGSAVRRRRCGRVPISRTAVCAIVTVPGGGAMLPEGKALVTGGQFPDRGVGAGCARPGGPPAVLGDEHARSVLRMASLRDRSGALPLATAPSAALA
ncbi:hypothetical protein GCM10027268_08500 [Brachybacterium huguangmaarense]